MKGEAYRDMLRRRRVADAGLAGHVSFDAGYRGLDALADLISTASVVVLPYDSPDQVTSGVLGRRRRRRAARWSRPRSRMPSSCWPAAPASSSRDAIPRPWRLPCAGC